MINLIFVLKKNKLDFVEDTLKDIGLMLLLINANYLYMEVRSFNICKFIWNIFLKFSFKKDVEEIQIILKL